MKIILSRWRTIRHWMFCNSVSIVSIMSECVLKQFISYTIFGSHPNQRTELRETILTHFFANDAYSEPTGLIVGFSYDLILWRSAYIVKCQLEYVMWIRYYCFFFRNINCDVASLLWGLLIKEARKKKQMVEYIVCSCMCCPIKSGNDWKPLKSNWTILQLIHKSYIQLYPRYKFRT